MPESLDELTYDYEDEGVLVRKQIERAILTKGSWATVMFLFQELDRAKGKFRAPKMAIVRFKKSKGSYRKQSSFNISRVAGPPDHRSPRGLVSQDRRDDG